MIEQAKVIKVLENNTIEVEISKSDSCSSCGACILGSDPDAMKRTIVLKNIKNNKPGDLVNIEIDSKNFYQAFFLIFVLPLMMFIFSAWLLIEFGFGEGVSFTVSVIVFLCSFLIAKHYDKKIGGDSCKII